MWVRLTPRRLDWVERFCPQRLVEEISIERVWASERVIDIRAPAVAWKIIRDLMAEGLYTRGGRLRRELSTTATGALRAVAAPLGEVERHPALRGIAMMGHQVDFFPVWSQALDERDRIWSPYPNEGSFVVLRPEWLTSKGRKYTVWSKNGISPEDRLTHEETHLDLLREVHG